MGRSRVGKKKETQKNRIEDLGKARRRKKRQRQSRKKKDLLSYSFEDKNGRGVELTAGLFGEGKSLQRTAGRQGKRADEI